MRLMTIGVWVVLAVAVSAAALMVWYGWSHGPQYSTTQPAEMGQFGDWFGWINAVLSFLGLVIVGLALVVQERELGATVAELRDTKRSLDEQRDIAIKSLAMEQFYHALNRLTSAIDSTPYTTSSNFELRGDTAFAEARGDLRGDREGRGDPSLAERIYFLGVRSQRVRGAIESLWVSIHAQTWNLTDQAILVSSALSVLNNDIRDVLSIIELMQCDFSPLDPTVSGYFGMVGNTKNASLEVVATRLSPFLRQRGLRTVPDRGSLIEAATRRLEPIALARAAR